MSQDLNEKLIFRTPQGFRDLIALNPLTGAETNEELYQNVLDRFFSGEL